MRGATSPRPLCCTPARGAPPRRSRSPGESGRTTPGNPSENSPIVPIPFEVALRPVSRHERVGEHNAVVWNWVNLTPARRCDACSACRSAAEQIPGPEAHVVPHHEQHIRGTRRRGRFGERRPVRRRVPDIVLDLPVELQHSEPPQSSSMTRKADARPVTSEASARLPVLGAEWCVVRIRGAVGSPA